MYLHIYISHICIVHQYNHLLSFFYFFIIFHLKSVSYLSFLHSLCIIRLFHIYIHTQIMYIFGSYWLVLLLVLLLNRCRPLSLDHLLLLRLELLRIYIIKSICNYTHIQTLLFLLLLVAYAISNSCVVMAMCLFLPTYSYVYVCISHNNIGVVYTAFNFDI